MPKPRLKRSALSGHSSSITPAKAIKLTHELKAKFRKAHAEGAKALANRDYETLEEVIRRERDIIKAHVKLGRDLQEQSAAARAAHAKRRRS